VTINGVDIPERDFMMWYLQTLSVNFGLDLSVDEQPEDIHDALNSHRDIYLIEYAEFRIMLQEAERRGITVDESVIDENLREIQDMYGVNDEIFIELITSWGFTESSIRRFIREQITAQLLYEQVTEGITELPMTAEEYFQLYIDWFVEPESRVVRHILVDTFEEAEEIIELLNEDADFVDLVSERSTDMGSAINGGLIGPFIANGMMMDGGFLVEEFAVASFELEAEGDITQYPIVTQFGYHIIYLEEIIPEDAMHIDEVRSDIEMILLREAGDKYFEQLYTQLMLDAVVVWAERTGLGEFGSHRNEDWHMCTPICNHS
jgi:parvulin-like peptidyl-prolyl isomerase